MFFPYRVDAPIRRWPIANFVILGLLLICYLIELSQVPENVENIAPFVLARGNPLGLIGHIFVHLNLVHLVGNMLFLWAFGNAVCARLGNLAYGFAFLGLGAASGLAHLYVSGAPAIGASGAINGIVGMFLVWFPTSYLSVFYLWIWGIGTFQVRSYWMILMWLVFDILGAGLGLGGVAYWAHLGGFAAGFALAALLLRRGLIQMEPGEKPLLQPPQPQEVREVRLGLVAPRVAIAPAAPGRILLAPPEGYFISFACPCGAELRAPRKRAGEECTSARCAARTKIPDT